MGWTAISMHYDRSIWFVSEVESNPKLTVIDMADIDGVIYAVVKNKIENYQFAVICSYSYDNSDSNNFIYRMDDESVGSFHEKCPLELLEQLPEPTGFAIEWRERCKEYNHKMGNTIIPINSVYKLNSPIEVASYSVSHIIKARGYNRWWILEKADEVWSVLNVGLLLDGKQLEGKSTKLGVLENGQIKSN